MSMLQVGVIGVLGVLFAVQFKSGKSEYAVYISVAVSLLLFGCMLERLRDAVDSLGRIGNYIKVDQHNHPFGLRAAVQHIRSCSQVILCNPEITSSQF